MSKTAKTVLDMVIDKINQDEELRRKRRKAMTVDEFIKKVNDERKKNKNNWVGFSETVNGKIVLIKFYNTWVQILQIGGTRESGPMDCSVKAFNQFLQERLSVLN